MTPCLAAGSATFSALIVGALIVNAVLVAVRMFRGNFMAGIAGVRVRTFCELADAAERSVPLVKKEIR